MLSINTTQPHKGYLVLIGGDEDRIYDKTILTRTVGINQAKNVVVIPTATSGSREAGEEYMEIFGSLGASVTDVLDIRYPDQANDRCHLEAVEDADLIFFTGGNQIRLVDVLKETEVLEAIKRKHVAGTTIAGTSAGAAVASDPMIYERSALDYADDEYGFYKLSVAHSEGFGFIRGITLDTHFISRHRLPRLVQFLCSGLSSRGIGLDEDTGIIVAPDGTAEVIGSGIVTVVSRDDTTYTNYQTIAKGHMFEVDGIRLGYFTEGTVFDLHNWRVLPERKRIIQKQQGGK